MHSMQGEPNSVYEDHPKVYLELVAISLHELFLCKDCFNEVVLKKAWYMVYKPGQVYSGNGHFLFLVRLLMGKKGSNRAFHIT